MIMKMDIPKLRLEFTPPKFSTPVFEVSPNSANFSFEELNLQAQNIFVDLDKLVGQVSTKEIIQDLKADILNLISS